MSIGLKVGEIDPPSVIMDVVNLPDPVYLAFTIIAYNYDDVGLYFQITGSGTGWTFSPVNLGSIGSGGSLQQNLDNFCNRARPASETSEQIQLILKAYTDSGYTNLKWTYTKTLDVLFIKSDDGSWTTDFLNNFDDGTVQGWDKAAEANEQVGYPTLTVATDYVLSTPYSLYMYQLNATSTPTRARIFKSFTTPYKNYVYAIFDVRTNIKNPAGTAGNSYVIIRVAGVTVLIVGKSIAYQDGIPRNKWFRFVIPLTPNTTLEIQIAHQMIESSWPNNWAKLWMDDFRIISKD